VLARAWKIGAPLACVALALGAGGCGVANPHAAGASVRVSESFGARPVGSVRRLSTLSSGETAAGALARRFRVVRGRGGSVRAVDGQTASGGERWFPYVNGIEARGDTTLHAGDQVWWDLHDPTVVARVPAVVGLYPEPFSTGTGGQAFPTVLTCATVGSAACTSVARSLSRNGVKVSDQALGTGSGSDSLAVLVGTFAQLRGVIATELLQGGPVHSGVYGQFVGTAGQAIELQNAAGDVVSTLHGDAGLIAATEQPTLNEPVWLVTGTTPAGVRLAAEHLNPATLRDRFAVAFQGSRTIPLPVGGGA
jgi:hypothetical protein